MSKRRLNLTNYLTVLPEEMEVDNDDDSLECLLDVNGGLEGVRVQPDGMWYFPSHFFVALTWMLRQALRDLPTRPRQWWRTVFRGVHSDDAPPPRSHSPESTTSQPILAIPSGTTSMSTLG